MIEDHVHGPDGHIVYSEPDPAEVAEEIADASGKADVQIAKIESDTAIKLAQIDAKAAEAESVTEVESLKAELHAMREMLNRLMPSEPEPEPEPDPVVIPEPEPEPEPVMPDLPPAEPKSRKKKSGGWWGGYASK